MQAVLRAQRLISYNAPLADRDLCNCGSRFLYLASGAVAGLRDVGELGEVAVRLGRIPGELGALRSTVEAHETPRGALQRFFELGEGGRGLLQFEQHLTELLSRRQHRTRSHGVLLGRVVEVVREIASVVSGPVSAEVVALDYEGMMREAEVLRKIAGNIAIKVPLTPDGLRACKSLTGDGTMVNVTLCFSAAQALLAAKAGATFVSPFVGRHDDVSFDGMALIADIRLIYDNYDFGTQILVASVRHPMHVVEAAKIGADVMTAPPKIIHQLFKHPLTDAGIASFLKDWQATGQSIG